MGAPHYFVSCTYAIDGEDGYEPEIPEFGPCGAEKECQLSVKDRRGRKTGPGYPLTVVYCAVHDVHFTLYPPGHVAYGRDALVGLAPSGKTLEKGRDPPFSNTYFDAALDAAKGIAWPRNSMEGSMAPRFITQCRHLDRCSQLMGLSQEEPRAREKVAAQLGIGGLIVQEAQLKLLTGGYRASGQAICQILSKIIETESTFQRLTTCGHYARIWRQIQRWDESRYCCSGPGN
jgi:hypothetical protein